MKVLITGIIAFFLGLIVVVWIACERADPVFLSQPVDFESWRPR